MNRPQSLLCTPKFASLMLVVCSVGWLLSGCEKPASQKNNNNASESAKEDTPTAEDARKGLEQEFQNLKFTVKKVNGQRAKLPNGAEQYTLQVTAIFSGPKNSFIYGGAKAGEELSLLVDFNKTENGWSYRTSYPGKL